MTTVTTIDLLRHGACEGGEIFRGSSDVALSEEGWRQMRAALEHESGWDLVLSSPLQRCARFAEELAQNRQLPLRTEQRLQEIHFGDWENRTHVEVQREHGDWLRQFWRDPFSVSPPNGESMTAFRDRLLAPMQELLNEYQGRHVLVVTHGAVIRVLLCEWLQMSYSAFSSFAVPYAAFSRLKLYHQEGQAPWVQLCLHRGEGVI